MSEERKKMDIAYGAEMVYTPGGESDVDLALEKLEYGLAVETGKIRKGAPIITSVHPLQIVKRKQVELNPHDIPVDYIITPDEIIECRTEIPRPRGIYWEYLDDEKIEAIPVLKKLRSRKF